MAKELRSITVGELLELLGGEDPDKMVIFSTDYGDHCHTAQALPLRGEVEDMLVVESGYSNSGFALADNDEDDEEEKEDADEKTTYLLIR